MCVCQGVRGVECISVLMYKLEDTVVQINPKSVFGFYKSHWGGVGGYSLLPRHPGASPLYE